MMESTHIVVQAANSKGSEDFETLRNKISKSIAKHKNTERAGKSWLSPTAWGKSGLAMIGFDLTTNKEKSTIRDNLLTSISNARDTKEILYYLIFAKLRAQEVNESINSWTRGELLTKIEKNINRLVTEYDPNLLEELVAGQFFDLNGFPGIDEEKTENIKREILLLKEQGLTIGNKLELK